MKKLDESNNVPRLTSEIITSTLSRRLLAVLDTNCLIDAVVDEALAHDAMKKLLLAHRVGRVVLAVSRHTLPELKTEAARAIADALPLVPHWPIGSWAEQVATWDQVSGTWDDAKRNQLVQLEIRNLANSGSSLQDRGAYLDALNGGADVFVTSDRQLAKSNPALLLQRRFGLRVMKPGMLAAELRL